MTKEWNSLDLGCRFRLLRLYYRTTTSLDKHAEKKWAELPKAFKKFLNERQKLFESEMWRRKE